MVFWQKAGSFFRKMGFDKSDERSALIGAWAMRASGLITTFALLVWAAYELIRYGSFGLPAVLFLLAQAVYWFSYCHYLKKWSG